MWKCLCDCGEETTVTSGDLHKGHIIKLWLLRLHTGALYTPVHNRADKLIGGVSGHMGIYIQSYGNF